MASFEQIREDILDRNDEAALTKLDTYTGDINTRDEDGWTLLYCSICYGCIKTACNKVAQKLLTMGADPNIQTKTGWTALHRLAYHGYVEGFKLLIKAGADSSIKDDDGRTALDVAITYNCIDIVTYLAEEIPFTKRAQ
jgi:ankyrin repeat protein